jgi:hypothetical protein
MGEVLPTQVYEMPEGMITEEVKEREIEKVFDDLPPEQEIKDWLDSIYDKRLPPNPCTGVVHDGVVDDAELKIVKDKAKKTIQENITKLYKTKVKKVAIVGTAMSYKQAPFDDPSWEIWGLNDHWNMLPRATRWFESQDEGHCSVTPCTNGTGLMRMDWYRKAPIPVYMPDHYDDAPMTIRYPLEEIQDFICDLDPMGKNYFTNTVSFMIALAIYEQFDVIHLYGVDMAVGSEYAAQRPSCEFWIGIAKGRGIKLYIPQQSDLLKLLVMYGMQKDRSKNEKADAFVQKIKDRREYQQQQLQKIGEEIKKRQDEIQRLSATKFQYDGSLADIDQTLKVWGAI